MTITTILRSARLPFLLAGLLLLSSAHAVTLCPGVPVAQCVRPQWGEILPERTQGPVTNALVAGQATAGASGDLDTSGLQKAIAAASFDAGNRLVGGKSAISQAARNIGLRQKRALVVAITKPASTAEAAFSARLAALNAYLKSLVPKNDITIASGD